MALKGNPLSHSDGSYSVIPSTEGLSRDRVTNSMLLLGVGVSLLLLIGASIVSMGIHQQLEASKATAATHAKPATSSYPSYLPGHGALLFSDPLQEERYWYVDADQAFGGSCQFKEGAFHVRQEKENSFYSCYAPFSSLADFTFEVRMTILQGDCGGITFREDNVHGKFYKVEICPDGYYKFSKYLDFTGKNVVAFIPSQHSSVINPGFNQMNLLAISAQGDIFRVFVNGQQISVVQDGEITQGSISLFASDHQNVTEVAFSQARGWTLS